MTLRIRLIETDRQASSKRFQAIMGMVNSNPFTPQLTPPEKSSRNIMQIARSSASPSLLAHLEVASRTNGCKKLEIDSIIFKHYKNGTCKGMDTKAVADLMENRSVTLETLMGVDSKQGSISLYETNM